MANAEACLRFSIRHLDKVPANRVTFVATHSLSLNVFARRIRSIEDCSRRPRDPALLHAVLASIRITCATVALTWFAGDRPRFAGCPP